MEFMFTLYFHKRVVLKIEKSRLYVISRNSSHYKIYKYFLDLLIFINILFKILIE